MLDEIALHLHGPCLIIWGFYLSSILSRVVKKGQISEKEDTEMEDTLYQACHMVSTPGRI